MKSKLFNLIFKKEIEFYLKKIAEQRRELIQKDKEIKKYKKLIEEEHDMINKIGLMGKGYDIVAVEENKFNQTVFVVKNEFGNSLDFELHFPNYKLRHATPNIECIIHRNLNYIEIADFHSIDKHIKNGYILMKNLINYAKANSMDYLKGELSPVDSGYFDYLEKYYKRFGFNIIYDDDTNKKLGGKIKLYLKNNNI